MSARTTRRRRVLETTPTGTSSFAVIQPRTKPADDQQDIDALFAENFDEMCDRLGIHWPTPDIHTLIGHLTDTATTAVIPTLSVEHAEAVA